MIEDPNYMPEVVQVIATPVRDYQIILYFDDGSIRQFDVAPLLDGPVFQPFKDVELFRHALT